MRDIFLFLQYLKLSDISLELVIFFVFPLIVNGMYQIVYSIQFF